MRSIEVLGAAGEVTGSAFVLTDNNGNKHLVDAGIFQEKRDDKRNESLNNHDPKQFSTINITHAHLDHDGRLPHLYETKASLFMTRATRDLAYTALRNADGLSSGLYVNGSVDTVLRKTVTVSYDVPVEAAGVTITFRNAGHILGSASLEIQEQGGERVVFSGDLGNRAPRTVQPTTPIKQADVVVMETTYGDRNHSEEDPVEVIKDAVKRIKKNKGTLLIPAFAIDRTQIILNILKNLKDDGILGKVSVFLDSPMAIDVTQTYLNHRELLKNELKEQDNPFNFDGLTRTYGSKESKSISNHHGPKIIIAGSGMMSGGRIKRHAIEYLSDRTSIILFVGYPAEGTPSRAIVEGEKEVLIDDEVVTIEGVVLQMSSLSAHADQERLLDWLRYINYGERRLRKVILVHGNNPSRDEFAQQIKTELGIEDVSLPKENEVIDLQSNA